MSKLDIAALRRIAGPKPTGDCASAGRMLTPGSNTNSSARLQVIVCPTAREPLVIARAEAATMPHIQAKAIAPNSQPVGIDGADISDRTF